MRNSLKRFWVLLPILATTATQCAETPRGTAPTSVVTVELMLNSVPATPPTDRGPFNACLVRVGQLANHVRPSWRATPTEPSGTVVLLPEVSPNVFTASFNDVPVALFNTMTVHDTNECARDPEGNGHVAMGVTVNGMDIPIVGPDNTLSFQMNADGTILIPPAS